MGSKFNLFISGEERGLSTFQIKVMKIFWYKKNLIGEVGKSVIMKARRYLGAFTKLRKKSIILVVSICWHGTSRLLIDVLSTFRNPVQNIQTWLKPSPIYFLSYLAQFFFNAKRFRLCL